MKKLVVIVSIILFGMNIVYASDAKDSVKFSKCVDGDTIKVLLKDKEYTVRMLAVDTPESVHPTKKVEYYGKDASNYTCDIVSNAKKIVLEYDENSDKMDKYDRLLAWVFVDGELLQEKLIVNGYAKVAYLYDDYKYTKELEEKQELASAKGIGVWNLEAKSEFDSKNNISEDLTESISSNKEIKEYSSKEIIIIVILILVMAFATDKSIKNSAKKKLKSYLK